MLLASLHSGEYITSLRAKGEEGRLLNLPSIQAIMLPRGREKHQVCKVIKQPAQAGTPRKPRDTRNEKPPDNVGKVKDVPDSTEYFMTTSFYSHLPETAKVLQERIVKYV